MYRFHRSAKRIDAIPRFGRCASVQVLMWPGEVVPELELRQRLDEMCLTHHVIANQCGFERAEEPFNPAILPRLAWCGEG